MKKVLVLVIFTLLLVVGCDEEPVPEEKEEVPVEVPEEPEPLVMEKEPILEEPVATCTTRTDCENAQCIEGECKSVSDLYNTDCESTCTMGSVTVTTSDGETETVGRGQGSFSYAGAVAWTVMGSPAYCKDGLTPIPVKVEMKTTGEILKEYVIVLTEGQTSNVLTHPSIERVQFTLTVDSIEESC